MKRIGYVLRRTAQWDNGQEWQDYWHADGYWTPKMERAKVFSTWGDMKGISIPASSLVRIEAIEVRENRSVIEERLYNK